MHWGVFAISAAHLYLPKLPWSVPPTLVRLVKQCILMLLIKKQLIWKLFIYWYLMSFFHKKNVTKCLGHHYAIWTSDSNFLLAQQFFFGPASPHFRQCKYTIYYLISVLTTVEGLVQRAIEGLSQDQTLRKVTYIYVIYFLNVHRNL